MLLEYRKELTNLEYSKIAGSKSYFLELKKIILAVNTTQKFHDL